MLVGGAEDTASSGTGVALKSHPMVTSNQSVDHWAESASALPVILRQAVKVFESLFERSADAIWLYDPETIRMLDCNQAAVTLIGAESKEQLLRTLPHEISPPIQP